MLKNKNVKYKDTTYTIYEQNQKILRKKLILIDATVLKGFTFLRT